MIPQIGQLLSIEMIRDGGSLAMSFITKGTEFWLFFGVRFNNDNSERLGYCEPVIVNRLIGTQTQVSWASALSLLTSAHQFVENVEDKNWLIVMESVAKSEGKLPAKVERFIGPWSSL